MTARRLVILSAAIGLLLAAGHTVAQSPPPAPQADPGRRLQALEQKMDRIRQLLDDRAPPIPAAQVSEKSVELIQQARDTLLEKVEKHQQAYQEWRLKNPYQVFRGTNTSVLAERMARDEATLQDLQKRQAEVAARMTLVKNVGDSDKDATALLLLVHRRGVDLAAIRQAAGREVGPVGLVRLYAASLRLETEELEQLVVAAEGRRDEDRKAAREVYAYEVEEERLRNNLEQSRALLSAIVKRLQEMSLIKDHGGKP